MKLTDVKLKDIPNKAVDRLLTLTHWSKETAKEQEKKLGTSFYRANHIITSENIESIIDILIWDGDWEYFPVTREECINTLKKKPVIEADGGWFAIAYENHYLIFIEGEMF